MAGHVFILVEILHDTGLESLWVTGPDARFGEEGKGACSLMGSANGAWFELAFELGGSISVLSSFSATLDSRPLFVGQRVELGSCISLGNSMVTLMAMSPMIPTDAKVVTSPATVSSSAVSTQPASQIVPSAKQVHSTLTAAQPIVAQAQQIVEQQTPVVSSQPITSQTPPDTVASQPIAQEQAPALPQKLYAVVFDDLVGRRIEISSEQVIIGSAPNADISLTAKLLAPEHLRIHKSDKGLVVEVLAGRDHTSINNEFVDAAIVTPGMWIVAGGARIVFDTVEAPLESYKPPKPHQMGASMSPLYHAKRHGSVFEYVTRLMLRTSPLVVFSLVFHIALFIGFLMVKVLPAYEAHSIVITSELETEDEKENPLIEDISEETDLFSDDPDNTDFEEFSDQIDESLLSPIGINDGVTSNLGLDSGSLPSGDDMFGKLPDRDPPGSGRKPTINDLRGRGLDITFMFDTTASMGWLLDDVKSSIEAIYSITFKLVRTARFAAIAYRDVKPVEGYVTRHTDFTNDLTEIKFFINKLEAAGGGDLEEAIQEGMKVASKLKWRPAAYKVMIIFADAPSHKEHEPFCLNWVTKFTRNKGFFHSVHAIRGAKSDEQARDFLQRLAIAGNGTLVPLSQEQKVLEHILKLVFGEGNKAEVEAALAEYRNSRPGKK